MRPCGYPFESPFGSPFDTPFTCLFIDISCLASFVATLKLNCPERLFHVLMEQGQVWKRGPV